MNIPLKDYFTLLVKYLKPQKRRVALLGVLLFAQIGLQVFNPQIVRYFVDSAVAGAPLETLVGAAALFIVFALVIQALVVSGTYVSQQVGWTATNELRSELAQHCLALDMSAHKTRSPGEWIERLDGDVSAMANFFSQFVMMVLGNALLLCGVMVVLWLEEWRMGLMLALFALGIFYLIMRSRQYGTPFHVASRQAHAMLYGMLEERLDGLEDIRANGAGAYAVRRFDEVQKDVYRKVFKSEMTMVLVDGVSTGGFAAAYVGALALGAYLFQSGVITVGAIFLILRYTQMLREPLMQISRQLQEFQRASAGIIRVRELFRQQAFIRDGQAALARDGALAVEFRDVSFEYDDAKPGKAVNGANGNGAPVLHDLAFTLKAGKVLGLLGRTGSGKTTVTRLMTRLYDPTQGAIRLGGADIRAVRLADLRRSIGMVTQDVHLFRASLRDNLTLFEPDIADERIVRALDDIGLSAWFRSLPAGLDTEILPGALSAGEAQLVAFARVLLREPSLVILDEASSRLDPATERLIERAVDRLLQNRTAIIIAHRLGTVQRADEIMILDDGRIREHGARERLAADPRSRFYQLLRTGMEDMLA